MRAADLLRDGERPVVGTDIGGRGDLITVRVLPDDGDVVVAVSDRGGVEQIALAERYALPVCAELILPLEVGLDLVLRLVKLGDGDGERMRRLVAVRTHHDDLIVADVAAGDIRIKGVDARDVEVGVGDHFALRVHEGCTDALQHRRRIVHGDAGGVFVEPREGRTWQFADVVLGGEAVAAGRSDGDLDLGGRDDHLRDVALSRLVDIETIRRDSDFDTIVSACRYGDETFVIHKGFAVRGGESRRPDLAREPDISAFGVEHILALDQIITSAVDLIEGLVAERCEPLIGGEIGIALRIHGERLTAQGVIELIAERLPAVDRLDGFVLPALRGVERDGEGDFVDPAPTLRDEGVILVVEHEVAAEGSAADAEDDIAHADRRRVEGDGEVVAAEFAAVKEAARHLDCVVRAVHGRALEARGVVKFLHERRGVDDGDGEGDFRGVDDARCLKAVESDSILLLQARDAFRGDGGRLDEIERLAAARILRGDEFCRLRGQLVRGEREHRILHGVAARALDDVVDGGGFLAARSEDQLISEDEPLRSLGCIVRRIVDRTDAHLIVGGGGLAVHIPVRSAVGSRETDFEVRRALSRTQGIDAVHADAAKSGAVIHLVGEAEGDFHFHGIDDAVDGGLDLGRDVVAQRDMVKSFLRGERKPAYAHFPVGAGVRAVVGRGVGEYEVVKVLADERICIGRTRLRARDERFGEIDVAIGHRIGGVVRLCGDLDLGEIDLDISGVEDSSPFAEHGEFVVLAIDLVQPFEGVVVPVKFVARTDGDGDEDIVIVVAARLIETLRLHVDKRLVSAFRRRSRIRVGGGGDVEVLALDDAVDGGRGGGGGKSLQARIHIDTLKRDVECERLGRD